MVGGAPLNIVTAVVMKNTKLLIVLLYMIDAVLGQGPLGRFTESPYYGTVYRHQPQHTRIVQLAVEPTPVSGMSNPPSSLQEAIYFSNNIDSQFYLHSQTGYIMVDARELIEGNYTFTAYANYTAMISGFTTTMESLSVMVVVRVLPEFYFVGTEQDGNYLAYVSTDAPVGTHVTNITPQFTLLNKTMFAYSIDGVESSSLPVSFTSTGSLELTRSNNSAGVLQFVAVCSAAYPSSDVIETLRVLVTIVFYQFSDLQSSNLTFNSTNGLIMWISPPATNVSNNLLPLANYDIRIDVVNGDDSYIDGPNVLSSSTNSFTYQPLIAQAKLCITLIAVFVRGISGNVTINATVTTTGVALQPPQSVNISSDSVAGRLIIRWQPPSSPPVNIMRYVLRLTYTARQPHSNESNFKELLRNHSHDILSHQINQLPGDTSYNVVVVALYSNGQRVPTSPVQHTLPGYAPSDAPNIVETEFMPASTIRVTWNTLFFSNGDITNYTVQFVNVFNNSFTVTLRGNNISLHRDIFGNSPFVNVTVRASNQFGDGPRSPVTIISTNGVPGNVTVENITDSSACFVWSPPPNARPLTYAVLINGDEVARTGMGQTTYCETQIASDSSARVIIEARYLLTSTTYSNSPVNFHTVEAPYNFMAFSPTNVSVMLEWSPPEPTNAMTQGIRIERYELNIALSEFPDTFGPYPVNVIGRNSSVFGFLQPGMVYSVTLVAVYSNNARASSLPASFTTLVNVPPSIGPRNLIISYNTTSALAVFQWDPVYLSNGPITGYRLYIGDSDGIYAQGGSNTTLKVSVRRDTEISVGVVAINSAGESSPIVQVFSLNTAPGTLRIFVLNMSSVRLFWDPPALFIVDFMYYLLNVYINGTTVDSVMVDANSHVYNGLISSTTRTSVYSFQVIAMYPSVSSSSNIVSIETACSEGTFKAVNGSGACQNCPLTLSSKPGSANCSCASGYEPSETQCTACVESFYKDSIGNATCIPCPPFSDVLATGSNTLSNCTCTFSSGTAEQGCYAFESKASVQMPSDREISNSWVVVSWDPLTSVVDRNGNSLGAVMGFYITYQVVSVKRDAAGGNAINITNGMETSVNLTGLQQGSQYDVTVSPYIEGFQLGPPTIIAVNTLPLVDGNTTMITMTSTVSPTITPTASTPADGGGSSDEVLSMMMIIIIAAVVGGAIIVLLLIVCCCIICAVYRRKRSDKATISASTKKMMEDRNNNSLTPIFKEVPDQEMDVLENPSFVDESTQKEHVFDGKKDTTSTECVYEDVGEKTQQENVYNEDYYVQEKGNSDKANQVYEIERLATPSDYGNEALYEEMTARYYNICQSNQLTLPEVNRNKMTLLEQLGEGEFGRVVKGIASEIVNGEPETVVAVKQLKEGASNNDKKNFLGEANLMSQFCHPNILTLLGVVTVDEPVLVIIPFMKNGDLQSFLSKSSEPAAQLTYEDKLNISVQVASGMEYLAARFFIHRDLAARNILVGDQLHVKISDFGLSRALQDNTYYKLSSTAKLPVKWMALESIEYRKFSTFSDVWSYGVVLWEIFSLGVKPYKGVPAASMPTYIRSGKRLAKPADCTDEIYQLMTQCWLVQKDSRPTFTKLKMEITKLLNKEKS